MENKKTKAPAIKAPKINPEIEKLKTLLAEQEKNNDKLLANIKELESQLSEHHKVVSLLWDEIISYRNAGLFTKIKNLFS
jgi:septal ring factor EnvC (AmiA/AmiB activator)